MSRRGDQEEEEVETSSSRLLKVAALAVTGIGIAAWGASKFFGSASEKEEREEDRKMKDERRFGLLTNSYENNSNRFPIYRSQLQSFEEEEKLHDSRYVLESWTGTVLKIWQPPPLGWVKVNCDGSFRNGIATAGDDGSFVNGIAAAGGLVRDERGKWLGGFVINKPSCSRKSSEAEYLALLEGLKLALNLGFRKVIAESDLESAIEQVRDDQRKPTGFHKDIILEIRNLRDQLPWKVDFQVIHREANSAADRLASLADQYQPGEAVKLDHPPPAIEHYLRQDILRMH